MIAETDLAQTNGQRLRRIFRRLPRGVPAKRRVHMVIGRHGELKL
jgi:hypothetical protein